MSYANHNSTLRLGGPRSSDRRTMPVPQTTEGPESRFLFRFDRDGGWVQPSGFVDRTLLREVVVGERAAAGGIVLASEGPWEVRFALGDAECRRPALVRLEEWSVLNRIPIAVLPGTVPLRPFPGRWDAWTCTNCGRRRAGPPAMSMPYAPSHRWRRTVCPCGGHLLPDREDDA